MEQTKNKNNKINERKEKENKGNKNKNKNKEKERKEKRGEKKATTKQIPLFCGCITCTYSTSIHYSHVAQMGFDYTTNNFFFKIICSDNLKII